MLRDKTADELHDAREKHFADCDSREAAGDRRSQEREKTVTAREKAAAELAAKAEALMKEAREQHTAMKRRILSSPKRLRSSLINIFTLVPPRAATYLRLTCAGEATASKIAPLQPNFVDNWN